MADYILIESRDPFDSAEAGRFLDLAEGLAKEGSEVALFLVQNAVLAARHGAQSSALAASRPTASRCWPIFSLQERGISPNRLIAGIAVAPLSAVIDYMAAGRRALWH
jgi:sulfur relay (sulfurtransferase) complex TusBCD TusD component (DsrE family)